MKGKQYINKSPQEIRKNFKSSYNSLVLAMKNFDDGHNSEAKILAAIISTFVFDHGKSQKSLLTLINRKDIYFENTARPVQNNNLMPEYPLCTIVIGNNSGIKAALKRH